MTVIELLKYCSRSKDKCKKVYFVSFKIYNTHYAGSTNSIYLKAHG